MELREYQKIIAQKIDRLFKGIGREERSFVGVKLPTGGGKSFIFMDQLIKFSEEYNKENPPKGDCISEVPVKYYAPLKDILTQTKINVVKYILIDEYVKKVKSEKKINEIGIEDVKSAIDMISERMLDKTGTKGRNREITKKIIDYMYSEKIESGKEPEKILREILTAELYLMTDNIEKLVESEFPNLEFICYQNLKDRESREQEFKESELSEQDLKELGLSEQNSKKDPVLIVWDEAHKAGAKEWIKKLKYIVKLFKNTKFLAITATPERDVDGIDPIEEFAKLFGYTVSELREKEYLASDMSLVTALNKKLVVKPEVINFDCMLDETIEYQNVKELVDRLRKKVENDSKKLEERQRKAIREGKKNIPEESKSEKNNYTRYLEVLLDFCQMCKLSGKLDFVKAHLSADNPKDMELLNFLNKPELSKNQMYLEYLKEKIDEIDNVEAEIHKEYQEWKSKKVKSIIDEVLQKREYLTHGKYICFVPTSNDANKTKGIMEKYKELMMGLLNLSDEQVLLTHSNTKVISSKQDEENSKRFMMNEESKDSIQVMVAMNKYTEGMHVDGIVAEFMCRQLLNNTSKTKNKEKDDPRITFLQMIGRCIYSIEPNEEITEVPVIFDIACNFMRYNDKLNNIFKLSANQEKFKEIYDKIVPKKTKTDIESVIDILQVLSNNEIDISSIDSKTTWSEFKKNIPKDKLNDVLDGIYYLTDIRITDDYKIGTKLISARKAFWHEETENKVSKGVKKYYNTATDKFFKTQTFEKLQRIGFFKDLEQNRDRTKVNEHGFVTGNCAELDGECQGLNIYSGNRYTLPNQIYGIPSFDVNGFSKRGVNIITSVRYNRYFFSYDPKTGEWTNLFTGKDEDLLGFDHNGNRVNPNCDMEFDQYGFNKDGIHIDTHCMYNKEGMCRKEIEVSERPEGHFPIRDILMGEYLPDVPEPRRSFEIEKKLIEWIVLFNSYSPIKRSEWYKAVIIENYEKKFGKNLSKEVLYRCKEYQESMAIINEEFIEISQDLDDEIRENDSKIERKKDEKQNAKSKRGKRNSEVSKKPQTNQASTDDESPGDDR